MNYDNNENSDKQTKSEKKFFQTLMLFRCTKREWAEQFCKGEIYLGSPREWIQIEEDGNKGQGDLLEGVFLSVPESDDSELVQRMKDRTDIESFSHNGFVFYRRKAVLDLRCLCLYGLNDNVFHKEVDTEGRAHYRTNITRDYFSSFSHINSLEDYEHTEPGEQSVVIVISNPKSFFDRIRLFLLSLGIKEDEIIISPVSYIDRYQRTLNQNTPTELLQKDKAFENQCEIRIIINSKNPQYLEYIRSHKNKLHIGSIEDITEVYDYYFDDMSLERWKSGGMLISLPRAKSMTIETMDFFELEDLLANILGGTVSLTNVPDGAKSWQEKLKMLIDLFYSKFGVVVTVAEDKSVHMYSLSADLLEQARKRHNLDIQCSEFTQHIQDLLMEQKYETAISECKTKTQEQEYRGVAYFCLGKIYSFLQLDYQAIDAYMNAFNCDYKRIESLDGIANVYYNQGKYLKAIEIYNSIQDEKGYDGYIWYNIGNCYLFLGQYEKAIENYDKAIGWNAEDSYAYYNKGDALFNLNDTQQAEVCRQKACEINPNNEYFKQEYKKRDIRL